MNIKINTATIAIKPQVSTIKKTNDNILRPTTLSRVNMVRNLYQKISQKLERFDETGRKFLQENFPISLGRAMIFHKCGDYGTSIVVRLSETKENDGAMRVIERKGSSKKWGDSIVINSFLFDKENRLLKNPEENNVNVFLQNNGYLPYEKIIEENYDKRLEQVLIDLEAAMLRFVEHIDKNSSKATKLPVGFLPPELVQLVKRIPVENDKINELIRTIPKRLNMEARSEYPNYKFTTATSVHSFQNLGEEGLTISFAPIETALAENVKRLYVLDKNGEVKDSFTLQDDSKMVTNINKKYIRKMVKNLKFADEKEILKEENLPTFEKYLRMYAERLFGLRTHIENYVANKAKQKTVSELAQPVQKDLSEIVETVKLVLDQLRRIPEATAVALKKSFPGLYSPPSRIGITFIEPNTEKMIHVLPLKHSAGDNLIKLTITEKNGEEKKLVIKDCKYVVKNYNPKRPKVIPTKLIFMNSEDIEKLDIAKDLRFFKDKLYEYEEHVRGGFSEYIKTKTTRNVKRRLD